jgi:hypothetical protein
MDALARDYAQDAFEEDAPVGGSAIETPLKTGYEGQPGDHNRVMHKFMSNRTNIA